jgi:hypothetical protein
VPLRDGVFTVILDFGPGAFAGEARWLDVYVRCPSGTGLFNNLTPRQAVTAAPYALRAMTAANAVGDTFCYAGLNIGLQGCTLTTDLKNVRTDIAVSTGATFSIIDFELNGANDSFIHLTMGGNAWLQVQS